LLLLGRGVEKGVVCGDALAAVAVSTGAMAQATISGVLDVSGIVQQKTTTTTSGSSPVATTVKLNNNGGVAGTWSTSELRIGGSEDLGGGLTASFQINSDLRSAGAFASRDRWLQLSGGFGSIRIGNQGNVANSDGFHGYTQTGTTGTGSTYGLGVSPAGTGAEEEQGISRQTNVINYTSPNFNGVSVVVGTARDSSDDSASGKEVGKASRTQNGLSVTYAAGPLRAGFGTTNRKVGIEGANAAAVAAGEEKVKANWIGASYDLGVATVGLAVVNNDHKKGGAATRDQKFTAYGVTVPMGAITLRASTYTGKDSATAAAATNQKLSGHQVSATYALSKRTLVYAYVGESKRSRDGAASTAAAVKVTRTAVGLSHSF